eukprot:CAMPEP_0170613038 /NCGR_PEP_ID=MMETSP0224-20130122/24053_1 /TAXON_ID=285029 /ORGANISM="Togula jolla, Strain CCCM 725" /LENGTH=341 /DNA_ID=CAMNT_0010938601 /DNA_START=65 /DNA_END=1090 /DNA_ORIENTATION=+
MASNGPAIWLALLAALACPSWAGNAAGARMLRSQSEGSGARITPELDPTSHKEFFNVDYPDDARPKMAEGQKFKFPYPLLQPDAHYDKDYVKDENDDGGEWKAQVDYDRLRTLIQKQKSDEEEAEKVVHTERKKLDEAKKEQAAAEEAVHQAKEALEKAQKAAEEAKKKDVAASGQVGEAQGGVDKETRDLEGCKERLQKAKDELKRLTEEKEKREKEHVAKVAAAEKHVAELKKDKEAASSVESTAHKDEEAAKSVEDKSKAALDKATKARAEKEAAVKKTEAALAANAKRQNDLLSNPNATAATSTTPATAPHHSGGAGVRPTFLQLVVAIAAASLLVW